jgi:hypothetical protein
LRGGCEDALKKREASAGQVRKYIGGDDSEACAEGTGGESGAAGAAAAEESAGAGEGGADEGGRHLFRAGRSDARGLPNSKRRRRGAGVGGLGKVEAEGKATTAAGGACAKPQLLSFCADE